MKTLIKLVCIGFLLVCLAAIRFFETSLFYDPLLNFFHSDYLKGVTPEFHFGKLVGFTILRFLLNTAISLLILYVAFKDSSVLKFSTILYTIVFVTLISVFCIMLLQVEQIDNFMPLFYVRRFLIQPVMVILLLPAFYYYKRQHD